MQSTVTWQGNVAFQASTESGHELQMDGAPAYGGENLGARPMELILAGLGGCASFDVVTILKKARQEIDSVECQLQAERADEIPAVFTKIHLHFVVKGKKVKASQVEKAIHLSADKYCSASRMLVNGGVDINHDFEVIELADV